MAGRIRRIIDEKNIKDLQSGLDLHASSLLPNAVRDYGAQTGLDNDATGAIQAMLDDGGYCSLSDGTFKITSTLRIRNPLSGLISPSLASTISAAFDGPAILACGPQTILSGMLGAPLNAAGVGKSINFTKQNNAWIVLSHAQKFGRLNGKSKFGIRCFLKPHAIDNGYVLCQSSGNLTTNRGIAPPQNADRAFRLFNDLGALRININLGGTIKAAGAGSAMTPGTRYHVQATYDGSNVRLWQDGVLQQTTPATGTILQQLWEEVMVGPYFLGFMQQNRYGDDPNAIIDQLQIVDDPSNWPSASTFTVPTSHAVDNHTLALLDFSGYYDDAIVEVKSATGSSYVRFYQDTPQSVTTSLNKLRIENLRIRSSGGLGILAEIAINGVFRDIFVESVGGAGLYLRNNSYNHTLQNIHATAGGSFNRLPLIAVQDASGASYQQNLKTEGGLIGVYGAGSGLQVNHAYSPAPDLCSFWFSGEENGSIEASHLQATDENGHATQSASMIVDGWRTANFRGCEFELFNGNVAPNVMADPAANVTNPRVAFYGCNFAVDNAQTQYIDGSVGTWDTRAIGVDPFCRRTNTGITYCSTANVVGTWTTTAAP